jgi:hypothetical protein
MQAFIALKKRRRRNSMAFSLQATERPPLVGEI